MTLATLPARIANPREDAGTRVKASQTLWREGPGGGMSASSSTGGRCNVSPRGDGLEDISANGDTVAMSDAQTNLYVLDVHEKRLRLPRLPAHVRDGLFQRRVPVRDFRLRPVCLGGGCPHGRRGKSYVRGRRALAFSPGSEGRRLTERPPSQDFEPVPQSASAVPEGTVAPGVSPVSRTSSCAALISGPKTSSLPTAPPVPAGTSRGIPASALKATASDSCPARRLSVTPGGNFFPSLADDLLR